MYDLTVVNEQTSLQPTPAVTVLRERLRKGQSLNNEVADWLQVLLNHQLCDDVSSG